MSKNVIGDFIYCGKYMVVVKLENAAHVMSYDEWKSIYGKLHPERWKNGKRVEKRRKRHRHDIIGLMIRWLYLL